MRRTTALVGFLLAMVLAAGGTVASAENTRSVPEAGPHFLTGPSDLDPLDLALQYLHRHARDGGLTGADVDALVATDRYRSRHNGVTHLYLMQRIHGIDVPDARANANVTRDGRLINVSTALVTDLAAAVNRTDPVLTHAQAVNAATGALHLGPAGPVNLLQPASGSARDAALSAPALSRRPIAVKLVYQPVREATVRLAWQVELETLDAQHRWTVRIDAQDGTELSRFDAVITEPHASDHVPGPVAHPQGVPEQRAEQAAASGDGAAYRVFGHPVESPGHGDRSLEADSADTDASPFGWHDIDGAAGPEFTTTRGNNVHTYIDSNADNLPDENSEPDGGPGLLFDFPLDLNRAPEENQPAAVTNLFYWNNVIHDVTHRYGFDEPAGNFQVNNFLRGGAGLDPINAETQDGGDTNNARFFLAPEGVSPRMEMYLWSPGRPNIVTVQAPSSAAGDYPAGRAEFGAQLNVTGPISGTVTEAHDGTGASDTDGCTALSGFPPGHIALLGSPWSCTRATQARNAQAAGAIAVIHDSSETLQGSHPDVLIPVVGVSGDHAVLKDAAPFQATLRANPEQTGQQLDSALDSGVVVHEYGHGVSTRLTGGPAVVDCLKNDEQMGEGWSDWFALALIDAGATQRGIGTYVKGQPASAKGIRPAPYATDMDRNPVTYGDVPTLAVPHGVGYAWASMLWDVYWNLVDTYGFNPDIRQGWQTQQGQVAGGNNLALQLVMDGLKLQPCLPGFVDGRNAILLADQVLTDGANQCAIWDGFARRGLGVGAQQGLSSSADDGVESFAMPPECGPKITVSPTAFDVSLEMGAVDSRELAISNTGAGSEQLTWTINEAAGDCGTSGDVPWLSVVPTSGSVGAGGSAAAQLRLDAGAVPVGKHTANLCVHSNAAGNELVAVSVALTVTYPFAGFFGDVANAPALNTVNATSTVPIIFSLGGDRGTGIFDVARPVSRPVDCQTLDPVGVDEPARTPGGSAVSYDDRSDRYTYPWSTSALWSGTCREFILGLRDGSTHLAYFSFR